MFEEKIILAAASVYDQNYYFNEDFNQLPSGVKDEIKIICVKHTAQVGGVITLYFNEEGNLCIESIADEEDILYDEIGSHLKIKQYQRERKDLFEALETFFKVFYLQ